MKAGDIIVNEKVELLVTNKETGEKEFNEDFAMMYLVNNWAFTYKGNIKVLPGYADEEFKVISSTNLQNFIFGSVVQKMKMQLEGITDDIPGYMVFGGGK